MGLGEEDGKELLERDLFPYDNLMDCWQREFNSTEGYSSDFIPALSRNKRGFALWVYGGGQEPLWIGADEE